MICKILYFLFLDMKYNYLINVCNKLLSVRSDPNINNNRKLLESAPLKSPLYCCNKILTRIVKIHWYQGYSPLISGDCLNMLSQVYCLLKLYWLPRRLNPCQGIFIVQFWGHNKVLLMAVVLQSETLQLLREQFVVLHCGLLQFPRYLNTFKPVWL